MKMTRHNGRSGKNGVYNPKHNDRSFDIRNSQHIDQARVKRNINWDCIQGYHTDPEKEYDSFERIEQGKDRNSNGRGHGLNEKRYQTTRIRHLIRLKSSILIGFTAFVIVVNCFH